MERECGSCDDRMPKVLDMWIQQNVNSTRRTLIKVLECPCFDNYHLLTRLKGCVKLTNQELLEQNKGNFFY